MKEKTFKEGLTYALKILKLYDKTEYELRQKLLTKFPKNVVDETIDYLKKTKLIDEKRYIEGYILSKLKRGKSLDYIKEKLLEKKVNEDMLNEAVKKAKIMEEEIIKKVIEKKMKMYFSLPTEKKYNKLLSFLIRNGYEYEKAKTLLNDYFKQANVSQR